MNWRNLPDAPESVKHWTGHDPSNPPIDEESLDMMCDCGHRSFEEEVTEIEGVTYCCNCFSERNPDATDSKLSEETGTP